MIQELWVSIDTTSENSTYEIDNGYMFSDIKKGNFYQISDVNKDFLTKPNRFNGTLISYATMTLDIESTHFESSVFQIMDSIGTIGGIFELLLGVLLMIYSRIRKSLYYHSIIDELHITKRDNIDDKDNLIASKTPNLPFNVASRDESKKLDHEQNRPIYNLSNHKTKHDTNYRLENYFQGQMEQIRKRGVVNREHEIDIINQICRNI